MARPYQVPGLRFLLGPAPSAASEQVRALQQDLRALGYLDAGVDGVFWHRTARALAAIRYDLLHNDGSSYADDGQAPVAWRDYNRGRVTAIDGTLDQPLAACIAELLADPQLIQVPRAENPKIQNGKALQALAGNGQTRAPMPFLLAMFQQESNCQHYAVPTRVDADDFVIVGLDHNDSHNPDRITSRGYGIGQYTFYHHPLSAAEMSRYVADPIANGLAAVAELRGKFDHDVVGRYGAADRQAEHPGMKLRLCRYPPADPRYLRDCRNCARTAATTPIMEGVPLYRGSHLSYVPTHNYADADYGAVPDRADFQCDWPYAARRYNGGGVDSYHYQARILRNLARLPTDAQEIGA